MLTPPLNFAVTIANFAVVDQQATGKFTTFSNGFEFDKSGRPHVCYSEGDTLNGPFVTYHTMWIGSAWTPRFLVREWRHTGTVCRPQRGDETLPLPPTKGLSSEHYRPAARLANGTWQNPVLVRRTNGRYPVIMGSAIRNARAGARMLLMEYNPGGPSAEGGDLKCFVHDGDTGYLRGVKQIRLSRGTLIEIDQVNRIVTYRVPNDVTDWEYRDQMEGLHRLTISS